VPNRCQLRLAFSNSNSSSESATGLSHKSRTLRSKSFACSPLQKKIAALERTSPGGAALVEKLVDDILEGPPTFWPPLE
jgi:hypothetical protein